MGLAEHKNVIYVDHHKLVEERPEDVIHGSLESCGCIGQPKAAPLQELINKSNYLHWGERQACASQRLKDALCTAPVLIIPDLNKPFTVISDASLQGTGAVLLQEDRPCAYTSRKFNPAERNYHTTDQELLGIGRALSEWRCYLEGSDCTLQTDHNVLIHLQTQLTLNRRQVRWLEFLTHFEPGLKWHYRPGKTMVADHLSRNAALCFTICPSVTTGAQPRHSLLARIQQAYANDQWIQANKAKFRRHKGLYTVGNKIVVPADKTLRGDIIQAHHTPKYAGHKGRKKTHAAIKHTFWWPRLHIDVNHFVNTCDACQRNKHST